MTEETIDTLYSAVENLNCDVKILTTKLNTFVNNQYSQKLVDLAKKYQKDILEYVNNAGDIIQRFQNELKALSDYYENELNRYLSKSQSSYNEFMDECKECLEESQETSKQIKKSLSSVNAQVYFIYNNGNKYPIQDELLCSYPQSYFYELYKDTGARDKDGNIYIDHNDKNKELWLKYMLDEPIPIEDMENKEKIELLQDLEFFRFPIKIPYLNQLYHDIKHDKIEAWEKRIISINYRHYKHIDEYLKKINRFDEYFDNSKLKNIEYSEEFECYFINIKNKHFPEIIDKYLDTNRIDKYTLKRLSASVPFQQIIDEFSFFHVQITPALINEIQACLDSCFLHSAILTTREYDSTLLSWLPSQPHNGKWYMAFRASQYQFSALEFHKKCDFIGPTLILIQSDDGSVFGGYTEASWRFIKVTNGFEKIGSDKANDNNAFIFSLINPLHAPRMFLKRHNSHYAITRNNKWGPTFSGTEYIDIRIEDQQNIDNCLIFNNGEHGYECDHFYYSSYFIHSEELGQNKPIHFKVKEYEVYALTGYSQASR